MSQQFTVIIERDPESNWLVGSVAELPGCYTQAPTMAELEANVQEAIQVYLETVGKQDKCDPFSNFFQKTRLTGPPMCARMRSTNQALTGTSKRLTRARDGRPPAERLPRHKSPKTTRERTSERRIVSANMRSRLAPLSAL